MTLRKSNPIHQSGHYFGINVYDWLMEEKADWEEVNISKRGIVIDNRWS